MLDAAIDGLGRSVAGAGEVEVGQDVRRAAVQGAAELAQLDQGGGNAAAERVDHGPQLLSSDSPIRVAVGGDDALIDRPGGLDLDVLIDLEDGVDAGSLSFGEHRLAGVQGAANTVERIAGMATVSEGGLLDALSTVVKRVAGELDDMEQVHHLDRVRERLGCGGLEAGEAVHRDDLDPVPESRGLCVQPGLEHRLRTALDHVQQPGRTGAVAHRGEVNDDSHVTVAEPRVSPSVLVDTEHPHPVEAGRILDEDPAALGQHRAVRGVPGHPLASCRDYWAKYEFDAHVSPTANMHDAVTAVELALAEAEALLGHPLIDDAVVDPETGEIESVVTIVTDNGGPFRSFTFEALIAGHPELCHVRTRVRTPGQNGSRERGFGTMRYGWLFREEIDSGLDLVEQINAYRHDYNHVRPHEAIAWNRPADVYLGLADPRIPNFETEESLPTT